MRTRLFALTLAVVAGSSLLSSFAGTALTLSMLELYGLRVAVVNGIAFSVALIVATPVGGVLCDRHEPRVLLSLSQVVVALGYGAVGLVIGRDTGTAVLVIPVAMGAVGIVQALTAPGARVLVQHCRHHVVSSRAYPTVRAGQNIARVLGPGAAGLVIGRGASWLPFALVAVCAVLLGLMARQLPLMRIARNELAGRAVGADPRSASLPRMVGAVRGWVGDLAAGARAFVDYPWLVALSASSFVVLAAWTAGFRYLAPDLFLHQGGDAQRWGMLVSIFSAGSVAASLATLRLRTDRSILWSFVSFILLAPLLLSVAFGQAYIIIVVAAVVAGVGWELAVFFGEASALDGVDGPVLGRVTSFSSVCEQSGLLVGYLLTVIVHGAVGVRLQLIFGGALVVGAGLGGVLVVGVVASRLGVAARWLPRGWRDRGVDGVSRAACPRSGHHRCPGSNCPDGTA